MTENLRLEIVRFVRKFYDAHRSVPSVKEILIGVKANRIQLYRCFPGKMSEICRLAGVPEPRGRLTSVVAALAAKSKKRNLKYGYDLIGDYEKRISDLEAEAKTNPLKIPEYVKTVIPRLDLSSGDLLNE